MYVLGSLYTYGGALAGLYAIVDEGGRLEERIAKAGAFLVGVALYACGRYLTFSANKSADVIRHGFVIEAQNEDLQQRAQESALAKNLGTPPTK